ncbi:hypothetical protein MMC19_001910 [Ptychographa xylographoides]|nr:hypothetical protein [Ptychographa xylographoides]
MGWLWSDATKEEPSGVGSTSTNTTHDAAVHATPAPVPTVDQSSSRALTRDEQADAELQELLKELNASTPPTPSTSKNLLPGGEELQPAQVNHSSISPDRLYPTTMSCRAAFDSAFYCQSLGGQFTSVYRYGGMRKCSDQWSNFWFCMRTNRGGLGEEERKRKIQEHYKSRDRKYKAGHSSEDVWRLREERVEGAFEGDFLAAEEEMRQEAKRKKDILS